MTLAERAGLATPQRQAACAALRQQLQRQGIRQLRLGWADLHGTLRSKTLVLAPPGRADAAAPSSHGDGLDGALADGVGMVSTLLLKDTSDRTALPVFTPGALAGLPGFGPANNVQLLPDPTTLQPLPWAPGAAWLRAEPRWADGSPVAVDPRPVLQRACEALAAEGLELRCGLEVEFHVYRMLESPRSPDSAAWPPEPPPLALVHPGWALLADAHADQAHEVLARVQDTADALGLPLRSLEIELGPSQFEAVFAPQPALVAADQMLAFRNGVRQALWRAGYLATFSCKPPFAHAVASGWHLHHSLWSLDGQPVMAATPPGGGPAALSARAGHWLAGLLAHAPGLTALCAPSLGAYARYQGSVMAPQSAVWAQDNRGAMLRLLLDPHQPAATRLENRLGEPMANPYLCLAGHIGAGLDGLRRRLPVPPACEDPYGAEAAAARLPASLPAALQALADDDCLQQQLGAPMAAAYQAIKQHEIRRHAEAEDPAGWQRRETLARF